jgi:hypothetical protein
MSPGDRQRTDEKEEEEQARLEARELRTGCFGIGCVILFFFFVLVFILGSISHEILRLE